MTEQELFYKAPQRYKVLSFIRSEIESGRPFPSRSAIGRRVGCGPTTVFDILNALLIAGFLERERMPNGGSLRYTFFLKQREAA